VLVASLISPNEQIHVLQIVREALSNTVRHADASRARVHLALDAGEVVVEIGDDGRGLAGTGERARHYGLTIMRERGLDARVVMLTVSDSEEDVVAALRAGADGYLLKDMEPEDILVQLEQATHGRLVISSRLTELIARALRDEPRPADVDEAGLTPREQDILALLEKGYSNKLIARDLDLSVGTVKVHVKHILKKLKLKTRVEAAVWAVHSHGGSQ
jgi:DNA-binding NarL/FixJ family response regulator